MLIVTYIDMLIVNVINLYLFSHQMCFHGVVVITSALHAEGRGFEPRCAYFLAFIYFSLF